ncbi:ParB N-terminal domain-containing protein [Marivivens aquimaris]|uniref:ParB N-terminal domain-containing protein n=1 Tax=Marivivens aquimaris TaxID=2774876 RepID=UPI00188297BF|nr:ParB N-terminal domain-containing protein [Marivivens aquimaris]
MTIKFIGQQLVALDQIIVADRLRQTSPAGVEAIRESYRETGQQLQAIQLRKKGGKFYLIDGGHRIEAATLEDGWTQLRADVYECSDDEARLMEIDTNLASASMSALDTCVFLAERKTIYERLHPETKRGVAGALARHHRATELGSFADTVAEKLRITPRQVRKIVATGAALSSEHVTELRKAPQAVTLKDLQTIVGIGDEKVRSFVVNKLGAGQAKKASAALAEFKVSAGGLKVAPLDPTEQSALALQQSFVRANKAARRRFVELELDVLKSLIADIEDAS